MRYTGLINRYRDYLPISDDTRIISLGEGNTPLIRLKYSQADWQRCRYLCQI